ncbi:organic hydroperoxide resistance protein [Luteibacter aegosomatissinici]|uniref:organic hydroperoxide resistance protein n=1 Tax=Luteibacter aegosomatissinici TaxID=2911539 RepID=UPI003CCD68B0
MNVKYTTRATATGGRDGTARSEDGRFEAKLSTPAELGGSGGEGTNPEQLFAAGYAACFIGALRLAGRTMKVDIPASVNVTATVGIGPRTEGGFGITASLVVDLPGIDATVANDLVELAYTICPCSNATRNNVDVGLSLA